MNKRMTETEVVASLSSGMTIGIGGWAVRRKPMSLVRAIARSDLQDLTVVSYGGPDVGLLCATGKVKKVIFGFVTLDNIPLDPHFRAARQSGAIEVDEYDEGMVQWGLYAAAQRLPFLPIRAGLGSDVMKYAPELKTVADPYGSDDELVAMPPIPLDAALVHMNRADELGNAQFLGPDPYFDNHFAMAAKKTYVSVEEIVPTEELLREQHPATVAIKRMFVSGVVEAPGGAHFTSCAPDYSVDEEKLGAYVAAARSPEAWEDFRASYLDADDASAHSGLTTTKGDVR